MSGMRNSMEIRNACSPANGMPCWIGAGRCPCKATWPEDRIRTGPQARSTLHHSGSSAEAATA